MKIDVVIGAGYGDEGKGATVDTLCTPGSVVVRSNGGAQAGHTVIRNGVRHVFSHFGSGSLQGCRTFLSKHFVVQPIMFRDEYMSLSEKMTRLNVPALDGSVYVSSSCPVTTPYDVAVNILMERSRGSDRHGSVGVGFGETLERTSRPGLALTVGDLHDEEHLLRMLRTIRNDWVPMRLKEMGILGRDPIFDDLLTSDNVFSRFIEDCTFFLERTHVHDGLIESLSDHLVFEGAQGLMLDQDYGLFPHVTRSNTGLKNVRELIGKLPANVHYVTRAYVTRHGAGPLLNEIPKPYEGIVDETNIPNEHQGSLRFSHLDLNVLKKAIDHDVKMYNTDTFPGGSLHLKVTCMDQLPETMTIRHNDKASDIRTSDLVDMCQDVLGKDIQVR